MIGNPRAIASCKMLKIPQNPGTCRQDRRSLTRLYKNKPE